MLTHEEPCLEHPLRPKCLVFLVRQKRAFARFLVMYIFFAFKRIFYCGVNPLGLTKVPLTSAT